MENVHFRFLGLIKILEIQLFVIGVGHLECNPESEIPILHFKYSNICA